MLVIFALEHKDLTGFACVANDFHYLGLLYHHVDEFAPLLLHTRSLLHRFLQLGLPCPIPNCSRNLSEGTDEERKRESEGAYTGREDGREACSYRCAPLPQAVGEYVYQA